MINLPHLLNVLLNIFKSLPNGYRYIRNWWLLSKEPVELFKLSDEEFNYLDSINKKYGFERDHIPAPNDIAICNSLANRGVFTKNSDGSYTMIKKWRKEWNLIREKMF